MDSGESTFGFENDDEHTNSNGYLPEGAAVLVIGGPFQGKTGTLVTEFEDRVILSVPLESRAVIVEMDRDWVRLR